VFCDAHSLWRFWNLLMAMCVTLYNSFIFTVMKFYSILCIYYKLFIFCANIDMGCFHFFPVAHHAPRNCMGYMGKNFFSVYVCVCVAWNIYIYIVYIFILYIYLCCIYIYRRENPGLQGLHISPLLGNANLFHQQWVRIPIDQVPVVQHYQHCIAKLLNICRYEGNIVSNCGFYLHFFYQ